jgi:hypothetical protein
MKGTSQLLPAWSSPCRKGRGEQLCSVSYVQPVEDCPLYTE